MSITVLVAEDELLIAMDVMDELGAAGFVTVGPFAKTSQALDYCRSHTPDCAVLDVRLQDGESFPLADLPRRAQRAARFPFRPRRTSGALERYPEMASARSRRRRHRSREMVVGPLPGLNAPVAAASSSFAT